MAMYPSPSMPSGLRSYQPLIAKPIAPVTHTYFAHNTLLLPHRYHDKSRITN